MYTCVVEVYALTSRVTTFDDDLTPVAEEKETPDSQSPPHCSEAVIAEAKQVPYSRPASASPPQSRPRPDAAVMKETPDSVDEVTTTTLHQSRHNDEHMDVHRSSSDSDPESTRRLQGNAIFAASRQGPNAGSSRVAECRCLYVPKHVSATSGHRSSVQMVPIDVNQSINQSINQDLPK